MSNSNFTSNKLIDLRLKIKKIEIKRKGKPWLVTNHGVAFDWGSKY